MLKMSVNVEKLKDWKGMGDWGGGGQGFPLKFRTIK